MLNNYKIIKQIFIKYNCISPSSAPVERMFSLATHVNSAKRNRMCDKTFEIMVYHNNTIVLSGNILPYILAYMHSMFNDFLLLLYICLLY